MQTNCPWYQWMIWWWHGSLSFDILCISLSHFDYIITEFIHIWVRLFFFLERLAPVTRVSITMFAKYEGAIYKKKSYKKLCSPKQDKTMKQKIMLSKNLLNICVYWQMDNTAKPMMHFKAMSRIIIIKIHFLCQEDKRYASILPMIARKIVFFMERNFSHFHETFPLFSHYESRQMHI